MGFGVCVVRIWDADCADWADLRFLGRWIYIGFLAKAQRVGGFVRFQLYI